MPTRLSIGFWCVIISLMDLLTASSSADARHQGKISSESSVIFNFAIFVTPGTAPARDRD
jgi:hypothetical protein